ncbi:uncharacterized protein [Malus domestica]|uniref:uncharacterized protein n=1 Tax=Malus domestica TaxID=3750 RepID=UPI0039748F95
MTPREEHVSNPVQVPLAALAKRGGEQYSMDYVPSNIGSDEQDMLKNVANLNWSPFTDEIEQTEPLRKFNLPHFTLFMRDEDPDEHLMHYRSAMTFYASNDVIMCKIFAMTLQGEAQNWFHTLSPRSIQNFDELSLVFTKEYSSYYSIKKRSDQFFSMKNDPNESFCTYVKRFKAEKAKIIGCDDSIACSAFQKGLPADHSFFGELIMGENMSLATSYALAEKHSLWDEEKHSQKPPEQPRRVVEPTQKKASDKPLNIKSKPSDKPKHRSLVKGGMTPKS